MKAPVIAFFNCRDVAGKTFLTYHLAWMYADLGYSVVAADFDPQADLSAAFLGHDRLEEIRLEEITAPHLERAREGLEPVVTATDLQDTSAPAVMVGDPNLASFEEDLAGAWWKYQSGDEEAFRAIATFQEIVRKAAEIRKAEVVLLDLGSNLGAINRTALSAADFVLLPASADLLSLQALRQTGSALRRWRKARREESAMQPVGYVAQQPLIRLDRPARNPERWLAEIPEVYRSAVLGTPEAARVGIDEDPHCLGLLKPYPGLFSLAQEARKPIFHLKPADGAMGSHNEAVRAVERDFTRLAQIIAERTGLRKRAR